MRWAARCDDIPIAWRSSVERLAFRLRDDGRIAQQRVEERPNCLRQGRHVARLDAESNRVTKSRRAARRPSVPATAWHSKVSAT